LKSALAIILIISYRVEKYNMEIKKYIASPCHILIDLTGAPAGAGGRFFEKKLRKKLLSRRPQ
jgi:hypothetical protein